MMRELVHFWSIYKLCLVLGLKASAVYSKCCVTNMDSLKMVSAIHFGCLLWINSYIQFRTFCFHKVNDRVQERISPHMVWRGICQRRKPYNMQKKSLKSTHSHYCHSGSHITIPHSTFSELPSKLKILPYLPPSDLDDYFIDIVVCNSGIINPKEAHKPWSWSHTVIRGS